MAGGRAKDAQANGARQRLARFCASVRRVRQAAAECRAESDFHRVSFYTKRREVSRACSRRRSFRIPEITACRPCGPYFHYSDRLRTICRPISLVLCTFVPRCITYDTMYDDIG